MAGAVGCETPVNMRTNCCGVQRHSRDKCRGKIDLHQSVSRFCTTKPRRLAKNVIYLSQGGTDQ